MAFLFRENRKHGTNEQTDGVQHLMRPTNNLAFTIFSSLSHCHYHK